MSGGTLTNNNFFGVDNIDEVANVNTLLNNGAVFVSLRRHPERCAGRSGHRHRQRHLVPDLRDVQCRSELAPLSP